MGNNIRITYYGKEAILKSAQIKLLKKILKSNDEDSDINIQKIGKNYKLISAYASGSHGGFKSLTDSNIMKKFTPLSGSIDVVYEDFDFPEELNYVIRGKK